MRVWMMVYLLLSLPAICAEVTIHVPVDQPTIQAGIGAAVNGDTVLVASGTYVENIDFCGKAIIVVSSEGAKWTVIDGGSPPVPDHGSVVTFNHGEGRDAVLSGFTLVNGTGTYHHMGMGYWDYCGGGIYCVGSSPEIADNIIMSNTAGGIYCFEEASPLIVHNTIKENDDFWGGGIESRDSSPEIIENIITDNTAITDGGGILCSGGMNPLIIGNRITANTAGYWGAGVNLLGSSPIIANNYIAKNKIYGQGGAFFCGWASRPMIVNNTIINNEAAYSGGGLFSYHNSRPTIVNCIFWGNIAFEGTEIHISNELNVSCGIISYTDLKGGMASVLVDPGCTLDWGDGMIDSDPLFIDPVGHDYHLQFSSPCRGTGDDTAVVSELDFEGDPRIAYGSVDMGADEFHPHLYFTGDAMPGAGIDLMMTGMPNQPALVYLGNDVLANPHQTMFGLWFLKPPCLMTLHLGSVGWCGFIRSPQRIPLGFAAPVDLPFQAWIRKLTNVEWLNVESAGPAEDHSYPNSARRSSPMPK